MKKAILLLTLALVCVALFGCCKTLEEKSFVNDARPGLTSYRAAQRECRSIKMNGQMAWDDFDDFWMINSPSRLNWLRNARY